MEEDMAGTELSFNVKPAVNWSSSEVQTSDSQLDLSDIPRHCDWLRDGLSCTDSIKWFIQLQWLSDSFINTEMQ